MEIGGVCNWGYISAAAQEQEMWKFYWLPVQKVEYHNSDLSFRIYLQG